MYVLYIYFVHNDKCHYTFHIFNRQQCKSMYTNFIICTDVAYILSDNNFVQLLLLHMQNLKYGQTPFF